jgi:predicted phosphodiesterase
MGRFINSRICRSLMMRIAVLADIHGNLPAFEATLADVRRAGVDQIVVVGDLINGAPDSRACWLLAQTIGATILRGNHERYVYDFDSPQAPSLWRSERFGPVQWTVAQFSAAERRAFARLPAELRLPGLYFTHASPRHDTDNVQPYSSDGEMSAMFSTIGEPLIVRGHDHWCQVRLWNGRTIVTTGSVGQTLDEHPTARYVLLEQKEGAWSFQHRAVDYDLEAAIERFHSTGYLREAGPMARLMLREIATAAPQIVPFLRLYDRWSQAGPISLAAALDRFLTLY